MADLEKRTLGRTGLPVTVLGYGAMELRGPAHWRKRDIPESQAAAALDAALDAGINFVDTAPDYGESEDYIGRCIAGRRSEFFLTSKCGCLRDAAPPPGSIRPPHDFTRKHIREGVEDSLRRLKTDYLDLVQFHGTPTKQQLEENDSLQEALDLQREGKVRSIGMSSTLPHIRDHIAMGAFDTFQIPYSALERDYEEIIMQAAETGAGIIIRGGMARGGPGGLSGPNWDAWESAKLNDLLDGMDRMEFLLRFTLGHPHVHTIIAGTAIPGYIRANVQAAMHGPLPADVYQETKRRMDAAGVVPA